MATTAVDYERLRGLVVREQRLTERYPMLFPVAKLVHRARRRATWVTSRTAWARRRGSDQLPIRIKRHKSLLLRQLGESEMAWQRGKVTNLALACDRLDGVVVRPGETFSFNKLVGNCTARKGYVEGMRLSNGEARPGVGGGICQLANLVHWMVLHSPLTVTERSEHSFDPFPDNGRVLPWGTGCSIVYNYVDLCFRNDTDLTFQLLVRVGERYLEGELRADRSPEHFRRNEIWRDLIDRRTGDRVGSERLRSNCALVKYLPDGVAIRDVTPDDGRAVPDPRSA